MVVFQCGLKMSTRCASSGAPRRCRPLSAVTCVLPGTTQHKLQKNLQLSATGAQLEGPQARPTCDPRPAAATAGPGEAFSFPG